MRATASAAATTAPTIYLLSAAMFPLRSPYESSGSPDEPSPLLWLLLSSSSTVTSAPITGGASTSSVPRFMLPPLGPSPSEAKAESLPKDCVGSTLLEPAPCTRKPEDPGPTSIPNSSSRSGDSRSTREMLTLPKWSPLSICKTGTLVRGVRFARHWSSGKYKH